MKRPARHDGRNNRQSGTARRRNIAEVEKRAFSAFGWILKEVILEDVAHSRWGSKVATQGQLSARAGRTRGYSDYSLE
jgi:hypothetical protein